MDVSEYYLATNSSKAESPPPPFPPKSWSSWPTVVDLLAQLILEFYWQDLADLLSLHPQSSKEYAKVLSLINLKRSWCGKLSFVQDTASIPIWILMAQVLPKPQHCVNPKCSPCLSHVLYVFFQAKWKISQNPFSLHFPPGVSKIPSLWVNDRFSGNKLVQGKSLTRLFVKMSNLSVTGRIRHSSLGKYLQSLSDVDHTLIHSFESQKYLVDILLTRCKVKPGYPFKCKYGAIWFSAFSLY